MKRETKLHSDKYYSFHKFIFFQIINIDEDQVLERKMDWKKTWNMKWITRYNMEKPVYLRNDKFQGKLFYRLNDGVLQKFGAFRILDFRAKQKKGLNEKVEK